MVKLGKEGKVRIAMTATLLACFCCAAIHAAAPYLEGAETNSEVMSFKADTTVEETAEAAALVEPVPSNRPEEEKDSESAITPSSNGSIENPTEPNEQNAINWQGLLNLNSDVIGWLSVPGTRIDYPLVQAKESAPQYYLDHDIAQQESPYGCPYLEASAANQGGLETCFPIVYGHHLINGHMFSDFAKFSNTAYARNHATIILETPDETIELRAIAANIVDANEELIQTSFSDPEEFDRYIRARLAESEVILEQVAPAPYEQVFCFVTCSYGSDNERTLVYAVPNDR